MESTVRTRKLKPDRRVCAGARRIGSVYFVHNRPRMPRAAKRRWKKRPRARRTALAPLAQVVEPATSEPLEEDVTSELSKLQLVERPRRITTPPPIPRERTSSAAITPLVRMIGDWCVGFELGQGGMSTVYAVSHREFGKRAALKLSRAPMGSGLGADVFLREARVVQLIEHPAIPDVFATGCHDGRPYLVMERLRGETLAQLVERGGLERALAIELLIEVCDAVAAAHESRVIHCDLKPENVFVLGVPNAHGARIKLLDWGFARVLDEDDPLRGMIAGTLSYVAPEHMTGGPITPATDVYSLGVLMHRLLLGKLPPAVTAELRRTLPRSVAQVLEAMVAKEPLCRPTVAEVRAALVAMRPRRRALIERDRGTFGAAFAVFTGTLALLAGWWRRFGVVTS